MIYKSVNDTNMKWMDKKWNYMNWREKGWNIACWWDEIRETREAEKNPKNFNSVHHRVCAIKLMNNYERLYLFYNRGEILNTPLFLPPHQPPTFSLKKKKPCMRIANGHSGLRILLFYISSHHQWNNSALWAIAFLRSFRQMSSFLAAFLQFNVTNKREFLAWIRSLIEWCSGSRLTRKSYIL